MKAIYRGTTVVLVPESDNEMDQLGREAGSQIFKMQPLNLPNLATGTMLQCFECEIALKDGQNGPLQ